MATIEALGVLHESAILLRNLFGIIGLSGGRGRDRTYDQSIKSRMLYQLSYASFWFLLLEKEVGESLCRG
jgi:hypothetical protein